MTRITSASLETEGASVAKVPTFETYLKGGRETSQPLLIVTYDLSNRRSDC